MNIAELSVRRPVAMTMVYILISVIAVVFIPQLGVELYPSTEMPMLSISTTYTGVGPDEVDLNVTTPIYDAIKGVSGIEEINSTSQEGQSRIMVSYAFGEDLDEAYDDLNSALANISRVLPDDADTPSIMRRDMSASPIMRLAIDGDLALNELKNLAEDTVQPLLERLEGVSSIDVSGGSDKIIRVSVHQNRLEAYGLTLSQIASTLAARNVQLSSGEITQNNIDYEIVTTEYYTSLDDIRDTTITTIDGASIIVDDVADVYETFEDATNAVYINGTPGLYIEISKESDANSSTVAKSVYAQLDTINDALPKGISVSVLSDDTSMIDSSMNQVYTAGIQGVLLSVLIILFFLRNIKSAFIISLTIPVSILITLMVMAMLDLTINMMTMSGLILGMGMVVDSSIVILENIFLYREKGNKPAIAAILGSKHMINAIVASTLTTLCVFIPMLIYKSDLEMFGDMFEDLIITVCVSLAASLLVAVTLVPALSGSILQIQTRTQKPLKNRFIKKIDDTLAGAVKGLENGYGAALRFSLQNKFLIISLVVALLVLTVMHLSDMGLSLAPAGSADDVVSVSLSFPSGTTGDVVEEYVFEFLDIIDKELTPETYTNIVATVGTTSSSGSIRIYLPDLEDQIVTAPEVQEIIKQYQNYWSDVTVSLSSGRGFGFGSSAIDVEIISEDYEAAEEIGAQIEELLSTLPMLTDVTSDFEDGSPRFQIAIDSAQAATFGVSVQEIANEIAYAVNGITATIYRLSGEEYNIEVILRDEDLATTADLSAISISTSQGKVALDTFIQFQESTSPKSIARLNGERINHVTAGVQTGTTTSEAQLLVEQIISETIVLPDSVEIEYTGESEQMNSMLSAFIIVIFLAIFLVFAVMAAQFESLISPFIIFASIPLLAIGVIGIYIATGSELTIFSMIGIVSLVGIVVNNGIVLVDYTNQLVDKKMPVFQACIEAGKNRLQPILMSTLTTVLGMVPLAFFPGDGAEMMQPIAMTMVGGLLSGSFMTLFISPILYLMLNKKREKRFEDPMALVNQLGEYDEKNRAGEYS